MTDWPAYYARVRERGLNPFWNQLEPHLPREGDALDLGCGIGDGTRFLLERGLRVHAVDAHPEAIRHASLPAHPQLRTQQAEMSSIELGRYDLVAAVFSLFMVEPERFEPFWWRLRASLKPGGVFGGQLLGERDQWQDRGYTLLRAEQARALLEGMDLLHWDEVERDGQTIDGAPKHWHVFHIIAREPGP